MQTQNQQAFSNLTANIINRQMFKSNPATSQEKMICSLLNIKLLENKETLGDTMKLINQYKGSYTNTILLLKFMSYSMEKQLTQNFSSFNILKVLAVWVETLAAINKKKDVRLCDEVLAISQMLTLTFEEIIAYLNYISLDLISLLKSGTEESRRKYNDQPYAHLDATDLINFLKFILPKTLMNVIVPRTFFPATLLKQQEQSVDMLYSNQILQHLTHTKPHYMVLVKNMMKTLMAMELEQSQIKQLIMLSFKFYYLFHHDKNLGASQIVIEGFKKMSNAVRFALNDEILLFMVHLKKIGRELFMNYLYEKFDWISNLLKNQAVVGCPKSSLKPFPNNTIRHNLKVDARSIDRRYIQVYDRFSLLYFNICCIEYDITIRFFYLGDFNQNQSKQPALLFSGQKKQNTFEGSIEIVERGIYVFEFDNSYSWVKSKTLTYETAVLVPLELKQAHPCTQVKSILFGSDTLNEVPSENILGQVNANQIKLDSASAQIKVTKKEDHEEYQLKIIRNTGNAYEYETDSLDRFIKKLQSTENSKIHWVFQEKKTAKLEQALRWLRGEKEEQFEDQKLLEKKDSQQEGQLEELEKQKELEMKKKENEHKKQTKETEKKESEQEEEEEDVEKEE